MGDRRMRRRQAIAALGAVILASGLWATLSHSANHATVTPPPATISSVAPRPVVTTAPKLPGDTQDGALLGTYPGVKIPYGVGVDFASASSITDPHSPESDSSLWFGPDRHGRPALGQLHMSLMAPGSIIGYRACGTTLMSSQSSGGDIDLSLLSPGSVLCVQDWSAGKAAAVTIRGLPTAGAAPSAIDVDIDVWQASY